MVFFISTYLFSTSSIDSVASILYKINSKQLILIHIKNNPFVEYGLLFPEHTANVSAIRDLKLLCVVYILYTYRNLRHCRQLMLLGALQSIQMCIIISLWFPIAKITISIMMVWYNMTHSETIHITFIPPLCTHIVRTNACSNYTVRKTLVTLLIFF